MRHVLEAVAPVAPSGRPCKVVDGDAVDAGLGKSLRQLFEELMEAADVGQDDHPGICRLGRPCEVGVELGAVRRGEDEISVVSRGSAYRRQRWSSVVSIAHPWILA